MPASWKTRSLIAARSGEMGEGGGRGVEKRERPETQQENMSRSGDKERQAQRLTLAHAKNVPRQPHHQFAKTRALLLALREWRAARLQDAAAAAAAADKTDDPAPCSAAAPP